MSEEYKIIQNTPLKQCYVAPTLATFSPLDNPLVFKPVSGLNDETHFSTEDCTGSLLRPFKLEYSIHKCPILVRKEVYGVFPELKERNMLKQPLYALPTWQQARSGLFSFSKESAEDKDMLLENFIAWGCELSARIQNYYATHLGTEVFCDMVDPCSGQPYQGRRSNQVFSEVDCAAVFLRYSMEFVGSCNVIVHPRMGHSGYPATLFTTAPPSIVHMLIQEMSCSSEGLIDGDKERIDNIINDSDSGQLTCVNVI